MLAPVILVTCDLPDVHKVAVDNITNLAIWLQDKLDKLGHLSKVHLGSDSRNWPQIILPRIWGRNQIWGDITWDTDSMGGGCTSHCPMCHAALWHVWSFALQVINGEARVISVMWGWLAYFPGGFKHRFTHGGYNTKLRTCWKPGLSFALSLY